MTGKDLSNCFYRMLKVLFLNGKPINESYLQTLFLLQINETCGETFHAHKLILAARSSVFEKMFNAKNDSGNEWTLETYFCPKIFDILLR